MYKHGMRKEDGKLYVLSKEGKGWIELKLAAMAYAER